MSAGPDLSLLSHEQKDALIHTLVAQVAALTATITQKGCRYEPHVLGIEVSGSRSG